MTEINLLRQGGTTQKTQRGARVLRVISISFLSIVGIMSTGLFLLNITFPLSALKQEETTLLSRLTTQQDKLNKHLIIQDRLTNVSVLISKRSKHEEKINAIMEVVPASVTVNSFSIDEKNIQISTSSNSLLAMDTFVDNITKLAENTKNFKRLTMKGLSLNAGQYYLSLQADLL